MTMKELRKHTGFGNVVMEETEVPIPNSGQVLIKVKRSLISRGSELFRRYVMEETVPSDMMGYSDVGEIVRIGADVDDVLTTQMSYLNAPHAEYAVGDPFIIPDTLDLEVATFVGLTTSALRWVRYAPINPGDDVIILGQGIVGNLYSQAVRERSPGRVITVDPLELRCQTSRKCGADIAINASGTDSVNTILDLTNGKGAAVVVDCVASSGVTNSLPDAQRMVKHDGVIHLIGRYQGMSNPGDGLVTLDTNLINNTTLIGGIGPSELIPSVMSDAVELLNSGCINVKPLITHRLPGLQADEAYHFLYKNPDQAMAVILEWD